MFYALVFQHSSKIVVKFPTAFTALIPAPECSVVLSVPPQHSSRIFASSETFIVQWPCWPRRQLSQPNNQHLNHRARTILTSVIRYTQPVWINNNRKLLFFNRILNQKPCSSFSHRNEIKSSPNNRHLHVSRSIHSATHCEPNWWRVTQEWKLKHCHLVFGDERCRVKEKWAGRYWISSRHNRICSDLPLCCKCDCGQ